MKFYFCETCGKRLTDVEIHDKQLKGVFCSACAQGVMTVQFDAISLPTKPATPAAPVKEAAVPKPPVVPIHHSTRVTKTPESRVRGGRQEGDSKVPLYAGIAGLAVLLIAALALF